MTDAAQYVLVSEHQPDVPEGYYPYGSLEAITALQNALPKSDNKVTIYSVLKPVNAFKPVRKNVNEFFPSLAEIDRRFDETVATATERLAPFRDTTKPVDERFKGFLKNIGVPMDAKELETVAGGFQRRAIEALDNAGKHAEELSGKAKGAFDTVKKAAQGDKDAKATLDAAVNRVNSAIESGVTTLADKMQGVEDALRGDQPLAVRTENGATFVSAAWLAVPGNAVAIMNTAPVMRMAPQVIVEDAPPAELVVKPAAPRVIVEEPAPVKPSAKTAANKAAKPGVKKPTAKKTAAKKATVKKATVKGGPKAGPR